MSIRPVRKILESQPTMEGAGVKLRRAFGFGDTDETDPFLLFDDFHNERPVDYIAGFPWHPHRGIETITYVLSGTVTHADSLGNAGALGAGDVQWMTAGAGILHEEFHSERFATTGGTLEMVQLWVNLPAKDKMTAPRYQDVQSKDVAEVTDDDGTRVRVIIGDFWGKRGPVEGIAADPQYLDVWVPPGRRKVLPIDTRRNAFAYVFEGDGEFRDASPAVGVLTDAGGPVENLVRQQAGNRSLVMFDRGDEIVVRAGEQGIRFLLCSGRPLDEPVAWWGPIVMNTKAELQTAISELRSGTFIKDEPAK